MHHVGPVRPLCAVVGVLTLAMGVSACGGATQESAPEPSASTSPTASATPTPTPTPTSQPEGAHGVTYDIVNWDEYSDDPVVLALKQGQEAYGGSVNAGKELPALAKFNTGRLLEFERTNLAVAKQRDLHVDPVGQTRVLSSKVTGAKAAVVVCRAAGAGSFRRTDGSFYGDSDGKIDTRWTRVRMEMVKVGQQWAGENAVGTGFCKESS